MKPGRIFFLFLFALSILMPAYAANDYMDYIENSSLDLGSGFTFIDRDIKKSAMVPFEPVYVSEGGQKVEYTLKSMLKAVRISTMPWK